MERLKESIIKKSDLITTKPTILKSKDAKIKKIYRFAINNRGGHKQIHIIQEFAITQQIQQMVETLVAFLKRGELK